MVMFAARLADLREARRMTKKELAALLHVSASVVSQYESGKCMPGFDILISISKEFDVSTDYLLGLTKSKNTTLTAEYISGVSYKTLLEKCDSIPYDYRDTLLTVMDSLRQKGSGK